MSTEAIGSKLNFHVSNFGMMGGMPKLPKTRWLINHFIHVVCGLLLPGTFVWAASGLWAALLLAAVTQGIDQFRVSTDTIRANLN